MFKHKNRLITIIILIVVAVGSMVLYNYFSSRELDEPKADAKSDKANRNRSIPVEVYIADYEKLDQGVTTIGTLLPNEVVDIASEISGKVDKVLFTEDSFVKKGTVLVKINDDDLMSQLKRAKFQSSLLREKLDRARILLAKDAISRESFDQIETDYNMVQADIQLLEIKIDRCAIKAPFDGIIGFRNISVGSYAQPNTIIAPLVDYSKLKLQFSIPEKYFRTISKGMGITFGTEGDKNTYRATIYAIDPTVDENTRTMTIRALYDNASLRILPGMSARVTVGQRTGTSIRIPTEAIVPTIDGQTVWVVRDGIAVSAPVTAGSRNERSIEIKDGLNAGDSVVITGLMQVKEGSKLIIR